MSAVAGLYLPVPYIGRNPSTGEIGWIYPKTMNEVQFTQTEDLLSDLIVG